MKITLFAHSFPPIIGGAQTFQYYLAKYLTRFGHDVQVLTGELPEEYKDQPELKEDFIITRIPGFREVSKLKIGYKDFLPIVYKEIKSFEPNLIHSHGYGPGLIISMLQSRLNAKHVFTYHSTPIPEDKKLAGIFKDYEIEQSFTEFILQNCPFDAYIANSQYYFNSSIQRGVPKKKSSLVYYGIDLNKFNPQILGDRVKWGYKQSDYVICCPIRLIERKGIFDIIEALKILADPQIKLFIPTSRLYTPDGLEDKVINFMEKCRVKDQIQIVYDKISHFDMPKIYAMSDLMVLPSHVEGLGIVLLESLAMKKPVVAAMGKGITEIIKHKENGLLSKIKNPSDLANKIHYAKSNIKDMESLTETGYRYVKENFEIEGQIRKMEKIYLSLFK